MGSTFSGVFSGMDTTVLLPLIAYLMITFNDAGLICKKQILHNEVGLCNNSTGIVQIWHCRECPPGLGLSVPCGEMYEVGTKINHCVPCKMGLEYSDKNDIRQCKPCRQCLENEVVHGKCKKDQDTISCTCKPGYYRDTSSRYCMPCSWCCGDGSNKYLPECKNLEKKCSLQSGKSCAPTTPAPTTVTTTAGTISSTTNSSSKDPPKGNAELSIYIAIALCSMALMSLVLFKCLCVHYLRRKQKAQPLLPRIHRYNIGDRSRTEEEVYLDPDGDFASYHVGRPQGNSSDVESAEVSRSSLTSNELSSSALEKVNKQAEPTSEMNEEQTDHPNPEQHPPRENDCIRSNPTLEQPPSTTAQGSQPSVPRDCEDESARKEKREQQRELICKTYDPLVEKIPLSVMHEVGLMLNPIQKTKSNDYRMVAEEIGMGYYERESLARGDPMKLVFDVMISLAMHVDKFVDILFKIERDDVVQKMCKMAPDQSQ